MIATAFSRMQMSAFVIASCLSAPAWAQDAPAPSPTASAQQTKTERDAAQSGGEEITVTGWRLRELDTAGPTASRLNLSI